MLRWIPVWMSVVSVSAAMAGDWPQEFGPGRNGVADVPIAHTDWSTRKPPVVWSSLVGVGTGTPAVADGRVYVIGALAAASDPADGITAAMMPELPSYWANPPAQAKVDEWLTCFSAGDGKVLWRQVVSRWKEGGVEADQCMAPAAAPLVHAGKVYASSFTGSLSCFAADSGQAQWTVAFTDYYTKSKGAFFNGRASPLFAEGAVIIAYESAGDGSGPQQTVLALDAQTGRQRWRYDASPFAWKYDPATFDCVSGWASGKTSPNFGIIDGKPTVVMSTGHATVGVDARDGKQLWLFHHAQAFPDLAAEPDEQGRGPKKWWLQYGYPMVMCGIEGNIVVDRVFNGHGTLGSRTYAFEVVNGQPRLLWESRDLVQYVSRNILTGGKLYGIDLRSRLAAAPTELPRTMERPPGQGQFQCLDLRTGKLLWASDALKQTASWEKEVPPGEGLYAHTGNPEFILSGDLLLYRGTLSRSGLFLARVGDGGLTVLGQWPMQLGTVQYGHPVLAEGRMFWRFYDAKNTLSQQHGGNLFCLDVGAPATAPLLPR